MDIYVDPTTLIALGQVGELELLTAFDGDFSVPDAVYNEVSTEAVARSPLPQGATSGSE